eukprot:jgi/Ulvmu1/409/UM001_0416.1
MRSVCEPRAFLRPSKAAGYTFTLPLSPGVTHAFREALLDISGAPLELYESLHRSQLGRPTMQLTHIHQSRCLSRGSVVPHAFRTRLRPSDPDTEDTKTEKIYIGQGRYVDDNPEKYPDKTALAGGWAGGEKGLQQFVAKSALETSITDAPKESKPVKPRQPEGPDAIYIGQGKFIKDDPRKYPNKESAGLLTGATGGFAGGELGVKQFVEKSSLELVPPEVARKRLLLKDVAAVSALIAITVAGNYGFHVIAEGPDAVPTLPTLDDLAGAPAALSGGAQSAAQGGAAAAAAAASDPKVLYVAGLVAAIAVAVAGGRAVSAGASRATASAARSVGHLAVRGVVVLAFLAAAYTLASDW